jgi:hypothetical protein
MWIAVPLIARGLGDGFGDFGAWLGLVAVISVTVFGLVTSSPVTMFASGARSSDFASLHRIAMRRTLLLFPVALMLDKSTSMLVDGVPFVSTALLAACFSSLYQIDLETARLFDGPSGYGRTVLRRAVPAAVASLVLPFVIPISGLGAAVCYFSAIQAAGVRAGRVVSCCRCRLPRTDFSVGVKLGGIWARSLAVETLIGSMARWVAAAVLSRPDSTTYALCQELAQRYISVAIQMGAMPLNQYVLRDSRRGVRKAPAPLFLVAVLFVPLTVAVAIYLLGGIVLTAVYDGEVPELHGFTVIAAAICGGAALNRLRKSLLDPYLMTSTPSTLVSITWSLCMGGFLGMVVAWMIPDCGLVGFAVGYVLSQIVSTAIAWRGALMQDGPMLPANV